MITYVLLIISIILSVVSIFVAIKSKTQTTMSSKDKKDIVDSFGQHIGIISNSITSTQEVWSKKTDDTIRQFQLDLSNRQEQLEKRVALLVDQIDRKMKDIQDSNEKSLKALQDDNNKQLDKMRETVDEKLSKTINERFEQSFDLLKKQLESVYKSIGEMQNMANDVGNLTKMLSNVKTTGIFGEIQLGAILEQVLAKEQYVTNFVPGNNSEPVEFAIKLPGQNDNEFVYLPIDSKFPYTIYTEMQSAYENNQFDVVKKKREQLVSTVRGMAKDINSKYIVPPKTTNFAVMFVPVESLYAEIAKLGLIPELQAKYKVTVAGPTTMSALLNSLQMGFQTLAIQKKSGEVWKILGAVKAEFEKFNGIVSKIQKKFDETSREFDTLVGTRSRMISSKLRSVESLGYKEAQNVLQLDNMLDVSDDASDDN